MTVARCEHARDLIEKLMVRNTSQFTCRYIYLLVISTLMLLLLLASPTICKIIPLYSNFRHDRSIFDELILSVHYKKKPATDHTIDT